MFAEDDGHCGPDYEVEEDEEGDDLDGREGEEAQLGRKPCDEGFEPLRSEEGGAVHFGGEGERGVECLKVRISSSMLWCGKLKSREESAPHLPRLFSVQRSRGCRNLNVLPSRLSFLFSRPCTTIPPITSFLHAYIFIFVAR